MLILYATTRRVKMTGATPLTCYRGRVMRRRRSCSASGWGLSWRPARRGPAGHWGRRGGGDSPALHSDSSTHPGRTPGRDWTSPEGHTPAHGDSHPGRTPDRDWTSPEGHIDTWRLSSRTKTWPGLNQPWGTHRHMEDSHLGQTPGRDWTSSEGHKSTWRDSHPGQRPGRDWTSPEGHTQTHGGLSSRTNTWPGLNQPWGTHRHMEGLSSRTNTWPGLNQPWGTHRHMEDSHLGQTPGRDWTSPEGHTQTHGETLI